MKQDMPRSPMPDGPAVRAFLRGMHDAAASRDQAGLKNMQQLIQLRWIAVVGQIATISFVHFVFNIPLPLGAMLGVLGGLAAFNLISQFHWRRHRQVSQTAILIGLLIDVLALTAQLHLSGGMTNPFVFLYLLQVALATVLLRAGWSWIVVLAAAICLIVLAAFSSPVTLPADPRRGFDDPYIQGLLICFALNATLLVVFVERIGGILRERDAHLADLRQRAAEEEHIVRMGLLASGAAHELGTPLSTMAVILGDWQHLPHFTSDPELLHDVSEMQAQVLRCKAIVTGILQSAGETRGEAPEHTTVRDFLDSLAQEWRDSRPAQRFDYLNHFDQSLDIVSDTGLKQMLCNVLDNALEASPGWVGLEALRDGEHLVLRVSDRGNGFAPAMLTDFGKPYQSSRGRPGGGLGLFLALNVARTLGGSISARNREHGGALVSITLPLSALATESSRDDG